MRPLPNRDESLGFPFKDYRNGTSKSATMLITFIDRSILLPILIGISILAFCDNFVDYIGLIAFSRFQTTVLRLEKCCVRAITNVIVFELCRPCRIF